MTRHTVRRACGPSRPRTTLPEPVATGLATITPQSLHLHPLVAAGPNNHDSLRRNSLPGTGLARKFQPIVGHAPTLIYLQNEACHPVFQFYFFPSHISSEIGSGVIGRLTTDADGRRPVREMIETVETQRERS